MKMDTSETGGTRGPDVDASPRVSFFRATGVTFLAQIVRTIVGLALSVALARLLGAHGRGEYALALAVPGLISIFAQGGVGAAVAHIAARREYDAGETTGAALVFGGTLGALATVAGIAYLFATGWHPFPSVGAAVLIAGVATLLSTVPLSVLTSLFLGQERYIAYNVMGFATSTVPLLIGVVVLFVGSGGAFEVVLTAAISGLAVLAAATSVIVRSEPSRIRLWPAKPLVRRVWRFASLSQLGDALAYINYRADIVIVGALTGPRAVGLYAVGVALVERLWLLSDGASSVLFTKASSSPEGAVSLTGLVARTTLIVNLAASVVLYVAAEPVVRVLFGDEYLAGVRAAQILLVGVTALATARIFSSAVAALGRPGICAVVAACVSGTNISLNLLLVPSYGIEGAAAASTVSYSLTLLVYVPIYARLTSSPVTSLLAPRRSDIDAFVGAFRRALRA